MLTGDCFKIWFKTHKLEIKTRHKICLEFKQEKKKMKANYNEINLKINAYERLL